MSRRRSVLPTSHDVDVGQAFRPSSYFTRLVPIPGTVGGLRSVPARRQDCDHCGEELRPASFAGVHYRNCPNACMSTYESAVNAHMGSLDPDPPDSIPDNSSYSRSW